MNKAVKISQVASAQLMYKGACWTWKPRSVVLFLLGVAFCFWIFLFSHSKASDANIGIIANFV